MRPQACAGGWVELRPEALVLLFIPKLGVFSSIRAACAMARPSLSPFRQSTNFSYFLSIYYW